MTTTTTVKMPGTTTITRDTTDANITVTALVTVIFISTAAARVVPIQVVGRYDCISHGQHAASNKVLPQLSQRVTCTIAVSHRVNISTFTM